MEDLSKFVGKDVEVELKQLNGSGIKGLVTGKLTLYDGKYYLLHNDKRFICDFDGPNPEKYKYYYVVKGDYEVYYTPGTIKIINEYPKMMMVWDDCRCQPIEKEVLGKWSEYYMTISQNSPIGWKFAEDIKPEPKYYTQEQCLVWANSIDAIGYKVKNDTGGMWMVPLYFEYVLDISKYSRRKESMDDQGNITYSKPEPFIWK